MKSKLILSILFSLVFEVIYSQTIHRSACIGNVKRLDSLLKTTDINVLDKDGRTPLLYATGCRKGKKAFYYLLSKGADVNIGDKNNLYPIIFATRFQNYKYVDSLIAHHVDVNVVDQYGNSPMHLAVIKGDLALVKKLINHKTNIDLTNQRGTTAIEVAVREGFDSIAKFLIEKGADKNKVRTFELKGKYLGQKPPVLTPKLFAPNFVSTERSVHTGVFHPNEKEFYFSGFHQKSQLESIMISKKVNLKWTKPEKLNPNAKHNEFDSFITDDGNQLFFCSNKKVRETDSIKNADLWMMNRQGEKWSEPIHLGNKINSSGNEWFPTISKKGTLVFSVNINEKSTIYYTKLIDGEYQEPIAFDENINSGGYDYDPLIAPDESYIIFASNRKGGFGGSDLYIAFKKENGTWTKAKNMGDSINTNTTDYAPTISKDGKYLFFSSNILGSSDIYWISSEIIQSLKD